MRIALGNVAFEMAKIAACAGRAGNADTAREVFAQGLFPEGVKERVADLGTGYGHFAVSLARHYPSCFVWAVDSGDVSGLSGRTGLPPNILNCGETGFDGFVSAVRSQSAELGGPLAFDLAYILFPNPSAIGAFMAAAMEVVSDQGEIHLLTEAPHVASMAKTALVQGGFLVRSATLPSALGSLTGYGSVLASSDTVHWVVARHYQPEEFVIPTASEQPPTLWPCILHIGRGKFQRHEWYAAEKKLSRLFGRPISLNLLLNAVGMDRAGITLDQLDISLTKEGEILLLGWFADEANDRCGDFSQTIPLPPVPGERWVAHANSFNAYALYPRKQVINRTNRGVARFWHQRFLPWLAALGVDEFQLTATEIGCFAWARLGFDFRDDGVRTEMVEGFRVWLAINDFPPSLDDRAASLRHAWDLADFTDEAGGELGKDFLLWWGEAKSKQWLARFSLHPAYPGWRVLFKDQPGKA